MTDKDLKRSEHTLKITDKYLKKVRQYIENNIEGFKTMPMSINRNTVVSAYVVCRTDLP